MLPVVRVCHLHSNFFSLLDFPQRRREQSSEGVVCYWRKPPDSCFDEHNRVYVKRARGQGKVEGRGSESSRCLVWSSHDSQRRPAACLSVDRAISLRCFCAYVYTCTQTHRFWQLLCIVCFAKLGAVKGAQRLIPKSFFPPHSSFSTAGHYIWTLHWSCKFEKNWQQNYSSQRIVPLETESGTGGIGWEWMPDFISSCMLACCTHAARA